MSLDVQFYIINAIGSLAVSLKCCCLGTMRIVHAQISQARNLLETVWSLSETDKIGDGVLILWPHAYEIVNSKWESTITLNRQSHD